MRRPWLWIVITANLLVVVSLIFIYPNAMVSPGPLEPVHADLATHCLACHAPFRGATPDRCIACHALQDIGVRTTRGVPLAPQTERPSNPSFHLELIEQDCTSCHSEHHRLTRRRFSHDLLHPAARQRCASCHAAPANELHREFTSMSCHQCHTPGRWTPATFDHALLAKAALERCEGCHKPPSDNFHQQLTTGCAQCHAPRRWKPSTFNHDRFFKLDRDHNTTCGTCHTGGDFERYTCYGCHEHTPAKIRAEHEEEGIRNFEHCVSCHRSAEEEPGERGERGEHREDD